MEVKAIEDIFIKILRSELTETELDASVKEQLTPDVISALYSLSSRHDLAHIVFSAMHKCGLKNDGAVYSKFNKKAIISVYRNEQMKYAYNQICDICNHAACYHHASEAHRAYYKPDGIHHSAHTSSRDQFRKHRV